MKVLFAGTPEVAVPVLEGLIKSDNEVVAVLTRPDVPLGRKKTMTPSPVAVTAHESDIPTIKATKVDEEISTQLQKTGADIAVVVAYGALVPQKALDLFKHGWINIHFSLLPQYRGAAPVQRAIMNGESETGVTIFELDKGMDTGPVYTRWNTAIDSTITSGELLEELSRQSISSLLDTLHDIAEGKTPVAQTGESSLASKLDLEDAHIDFAKPASKVLQQINGVTPEPGAWALLEEKRFKIHQARISKEGEKVSPGELKLITSKPQKLLVGTQTGAIDLIEVQPFGKKRMQATDFARGTNVAGKILS